MDHDLPKKGYNPFSQAYPAEAIARAARHACILEAGAEKPGNVTPVRAFHDTSYADFARSAEAIAPVLGRARDLPVGALTLEAVTATRRAVGRNTNLGIVLLLAPLARAAAQPGGTLRERLHTVLAGLTLEDAHQVYAAIRLAAPGGLGEAAEHDVREQPVADLLTAMASAAARDSIAREYVTDYAITFELTAPTLLEGRRMGLAPTGAVVQAYLRLLAEVPDTLIARKRGHADAEWLAAAARDVLVLGGITTERGRAALEMLDTRLCDARNTWNPGTTADLIAAGLFAVLIEDKDWRLEIGD